MLWLLFLALFLICAGMSVVFCVYICLLWFATVQPGAAEEAKATRGLTEAELQGLPGAGDGGMVRGTECTVCLEDIEAGQPARVLPACRHAFHRPCVDEWLAANPACPVCRTELLPTTAPLPPIAAAV